MEEKIKMAIEFFEAAIRDSWEKSSGQINMDQLELQANKWLDDLLEYLGFPKGILRYKLVVADQEKGIVNIIPIYQVEHFAVDFIYPPEE